MSGQNDGGPAFPQVYDEMEGDFPDAFGLGGMSLRDYFAAHALAGVLHSADDHDWNKGVFTGASPYAQTAYVIADAMLAEREAVRND